MHILVNIFSFVVVIGFLIFVHELGHFLMAKLLKIRVNTFSLGFGPKIAGFTKGETEYRLSLYFFLGGYVSMQGEEPDSELKGSRDEFLSRSKFERFLVLIMGPATNIFVAFLFMAVLYWIGTNVPAYREAPAVIGLVHEGSPAERAGLQAGDRVLEIDGRTVTKYAQFEEKFLINPDKNLDLTVDRSGEKVGLQIVPASATVYKIGNAGVDPVQEFKLLSVEKGLPADEAGLEPGDVIKEVNGSEILHFASGMDMISDSPEAQIELGVCRNGETFGVAVIPQSRIYLMSEMDRAAFYIYPGEADGGGIKAPVVREAMLPENVDIKAGDIIASVNGRSFKDYDDLRSFMDDSAPKVMNIGIVREGKESAVKLSFYKPEIKGYIGIAREPVEERVIEKKFGFIEGLVQSVKINLSWCRTLMETVKNLFTGVLSVRAMSGPIDIAKFSGHALREGMLMNFIAFVSLNLGIMNLLPIPVLDGGHIFIILIEGIIRKDLSMKVKENLMQMGFFALITLMVVVLSFDLLKNIPYFRDAFL